MLQRQPLSLERHHRATAQVWIAMLCFACSDGSPAHDAGTDPSAPDAQRTDCAPNGGDPDPQPSGVVFSAMEVAMYGTLSPLPEVPANSTNEYADDDSLVATLGQKLFFDATYSGPLRVASDLGNVGESGKLSCFSCHSGPYLDDQRSQPRTVSLGADFHTRNAPTVINSAFYRWTNWGGRFSAPWELPPVVAESAVIMNSSRLRIAHVIFDRYRPLYEPAFGPMEPAIGSDPVRFPAAGKPKPAPMAAMPEPPDGAWEAMTDADRAIVNVILANFGKALETYMRKLVSRDAPFDRFVAGESDAISEDAKRGLQVFLGRGRCVSCHLGPHFSDGAFHNLGVAQSGDHVPASDEGRFASIAPLLASAINSQSVYSDDRNSGRLAGLTNPPPDSTRGQFRTPSLRGVALTAPYMHAGQFASLAEVIDFYDAGGGVPAVGDRSALLVPLHLNARDKADLGAFLQTLTGAPVPAALLEEP